jgi:large subunit ribosomal protein L21
MQYRVEQGQHVDLALLESAEPGSEIKLDEVLLVSGTETVQVGSPLIEGASVRARVVGTIKGEKILVFRYRNKKRFRRRKGHRQQYTRVQIDEIVT